MKVAMVVAVVVLVAVCGYQQVQLGQLRSDVSSVESEVTDLENDLPADVGFEVSELQDFTEGLDDTDRFLAGQVLEVVEDVEDVERRLDDVERCASDVAAGFIGGC